MVQTAANLADHVLASKTPLRQLVVTFTFELRTRLAYDGRLLGAVTRIVVDSVLGWYRRRLRDTDGIAGKSGAVTVVERPFTWRLDAVDGSELENALLEVRRELEQVEDLRNPGPREAQLVVLPDELAEREPAPAQIAAASVHGLPPAGPERRDRPLLPVALGGQLGVEMTARPCGGGARPLAPRRHDRRRRRLARPRATAATPRRADGRAPIVACPRPSVLAEPGASPAR